ncbi:MAG: surfeit locus 1 family protein [Gammaproteobacteria bacterium]|jgi:surfeit locus 1 family protein
MHFSKPNPWIALLTICTVALFCRLGVWQLDRAEHKHLVAESLAKSDSFPPLSALAENDAAIPYYSVSLSGRFDTQKQILLDNQVLAGVAGYEVISALQIDNGLLYLINRGWLAGRPGDLPAWETPSDIVTLKGVIAPHAAAGMRMGEAVVATADNPSGWPKVVNYPSLEELESLFKQPVAPYTLWLDANEPHGFERDWQPQALTIEKHLGYAFQWFALALTVLVVFFVLHMKRND